MSNPSNQNNKGNAQPQKSGIHGYAVVRFGMEYLRGDPRAAALGMSIGQILSVLIFFAGLAFMVVAFCRKKA